MKFSKFIWDLYRDSERGKRALAKFSSITSDFVEPDLRNFELTLDDDVRDQLPEGSITVDIADLVRAAVTGAEIDSAEAATEYFQGLYEAGIACELPDKTGQREMVYRFGEDEEDWYDYIAALSLGLHLAHPRFSSRTDFGAATTSLRRYIANLGSRFRQFPASTRRSSVDASIWRSTPHGRSFAEFTALARVRCARSSTTSLPNS